MDRLQLGEAWGHRGAAREPATAIATPGRYRGGIEQAALLLHLQAEGHDSTPCPQAADTPVFPFPSSWTRRVSGPDTLPRDCLCLTSNYSPTPTPSGLSSLFHSERAHIHHLPWPWKSIMNVREDRSRSKQVSQPSPPSRKRKVV